MRTKKRSWVVFAVVLALVMALPLPLAAQEERAGKAENPLVPVLSVQGTGQARVEPDEAVVRLGVFAQAPSARAAQEKVSSTAAAVLSAVQKLGIKAEQIQTSELSLGPVYAQGRPDDSGGEPRIAGYQASNVVTVRLEKLDQVGPVIDAGLGAGANRLDGVTFGLRNDETARAAALADAVAAARSKAEAIAKALRVRLGEVVEVTEGGVSLFTPTLQRREMAMAADSFSATPVSSGQVAVDASVTVRYRISPQ